MKGIKTVFWKEEKDCSKKLSCGVMREATLTRGKDHIEFIFYDYTKDNRGIPLLNTFAHIDDLLDPERLLLQWWGNTGPKHFIKTELNHQRLCNMVRGMIKGWVYQDSRFLSLKINISYEV